MARHKNFYWGMLSLLLFLGVQLFFLEADPHFKISTSHGPFTDEGLNTSQARNFVNHGQWGLPEGDNLVKSPLFNAWILGPLAIAPGSRTALRFYLLITCLGLWLLFADLLRDFSFPSLFLVFGGFQYHLFQFYHFTMVEMMVCSCALVAIGMGHRHLLKLKAGISTYHLAGSFLMVFIAFLLKIQYAYLLGLPFLFWALGAFLGEANFKAHLKDLAKLAGLAGMAVALFAVAWYLPTREVFEQVWAHQAGSRFSGLQDAWLTFVNSGKYLLWNELNLTFALSFLLSLPIGIFLVFRTVNFETRALLLLSGCWILLEMHKPFILYLPTRYALSLFCAQALWMAVVFYAGLRHLFQTKRQSKANRYVRAVPLFFVVPLLLGNAKNLELLWDEKAETSKAIIAYYNHLNLENDTVAGVWATGLVWNQGAYVIPVWKNFMNDNRLLEKRKPSIVVTEKGELDSEGVFKDRGIDLSAIADSVKKYEYGGYGVEFYFLGENF